MYIRHIHVYYLICLHIQKTATIDVEDFVAAKSTKYTDKLLTGQVTSTGRHYRLVSPNDS